jgi:hypothetical protein
MSQTPSLFTRNFFFRAFLLVGGTIVLVMGGHARLHGYDPEPLFAHRPLGLAPSTTLWSMLLGAAMIIAALFPWP